jgi:uncharacterized cupredoxin-like copper-binding protein
MRKVTISSLAVLAAATVVSLALVAPASSSTDRQQRAATTTIQVKGGEFFLRLSKNSIAGPGKVVFVFKNIGHVMHDFSINGKTTPLISPSKTARLAVTFKKKAKYNYLCTVPGHAAAGMKGVFTVR